MALFLPVSRERLRFWAGWSSFAFLILISNYSGSLPRLSMNSEARQEGFIPQKRDATIPRKNNVRTAHIQDTL